MRKYVIEAKGISGWLKVVMAFVLSLVMVASGVPTEALAEMVEETVGLEFVEPEEEAQLEPDPDPEQVYEPEDEGPAYEDELAPDAVDYPVPEEEQESEEALVDYARELAANARDAYPEEGREDYAAWRVRNAYEEMVHDIANDEFELKDSLTNSEEATHAFALVMSELGVECVEVTCGENEDAQYWAMVRLGDAWYHVDVWKAAGDWRDLLEREEDAEDSAEPDIPLSWLLVSDSSIRKLDRAREVWACSDETEAPIAEKNYEWQEVDPSEQVEALADGLVASGTCGTCPWTIDSDGTLIIGPGTLPSNSNRSDGFWPWNEYDYSIESITVRQGTVATGCTFGMFAMNNYKVANLSNLDTSLVTDMSCMFWWCSSLTSLDVSGWDTSLVTDMKGMFNTCSSLTDLDLSSWDTWQVRNMDNMFLDCASLTALDLSSWDTSQVMSMEYMFHGCSSLVSLDLSGWNIAKVTNTIGVFEKCTSLTSLDLSGWDTSHVTDMTILFYGCSSLASLDVSSWDTSHVTDMGGLFQGCTSLSSLDLSGWDTSQVTDMSDLFHGCTSLSSLDLSGWDTSQVTWMYNMFAYCTSLSSLDLSGWDTSQVTDMSYMFYECSSLAQLKVGSKTSFGAHFPEATASNGKWWSQKDRVWYTVDEIAKSRERVADVYINMSTYTYSDLTFSFANSYDDFGYTSESYIPLSSYKLVFGSVQGQVYFDKDRSRGMTWGGSCYGMASLSAMFNTPDSGFARTSFRSSASRSSDLRLTDSWSQNTLKQYVEAMQVSQKAPEKRSAQRENDSDYVGVSSSLNMLAEAVENAHTTDELPMVCYGWQDSDGSYSGHSVIALDIREVSSSQDRLYIYDPNFPKTERFISLSKNSAGSYTGWYYYHNEFYSNKRKVGSSYATNYISFVPYRVYDGIWKDGSKARTTNTLLTTSHDFTLLDGEGATIAEVRNGAMTAGDGNAILNKPAEETEGPYNTVLYLPRDVAFTLKRTDNDTQFDATVVNVDQAASVVTDAGEVTFEVNDDEEVNLVDVQVETGESYSVTFSSDLESASGQESIEFSGVGNGDRLTVGTVSGNCVVVNGGTATMTVNDEVVDIGGRLGISADEASLEYTICGYDGKAHEPKVTVTHDGAELVEDRDFVVKYAGNVEPGTAKATAYGIGDYDGRVELTFRIKPRQTITASNKTVAMGKTVSLGARTSGDGRLTYRSADTTVAKVSATGVVTPVKVGTAKVAITASATDDYASATKTVTVTVTKGTQAISAANKTVAMGKTVSLGARRTAGNGRLTYASSNTAVAKVSATGVVTPVKVGKATITITAVATANYRAATKRVTVTVTKGAQPMAVKSVTRTASLKTLRSKAVTVARPISFAKAPQGKVTYARVSGSAALTISRTTGKVTVKRGTRKGTYSIKVKVSAAGNANYKAGIKTLICKVVVK